jgi:NAD(P)H dehydrogenase (quinone)
MMLPLMHLGMVITGVPYSTPELSSTQSGGTPYGASHYAGPAGDNLITEEEKNICISQGKNLATIAKKLAS